MIHCIKYINIWYGPYSPTEYFRAKYDFNKCTAMILSSIRRLKPTAKDHRPIALTNVGYKIFMGLVKSKLVEHLERNRLISDYQAGFTGGRRLEENLFIVRYCIEPRLSRRHSGWVGGWLW